VRYRCAQFPSNGPYFGEREVGLFDGPDGDVWRGVVSSREKQCVKVEDERVDFGVFGAWAKWRGVKRVRKARVGGG
jgi:hypothetical protein